MEQTAVEFIEDYLKFKGLIIDNKSPQVLIGVINQAKKMEKQQIINALAEHPNIDSEQYYNETFKNK